MLPNVSASPGNRILIHAPYGRDGTLIQAELQTAGFRALVCQSIEELGLGIIDGAGAALIGDEALIPPAVQCLVQHLATQPPWSDFPLLIMTSGGASTNASRYRLSLLKPLGNVTLVERPLRPITLISSVHAALRARRHQYQLRDYVTQIESSEHALRESEAQFRFLNELSELSRSVISPKQLVEALTQRLGEHLRVSLCAYAEITSESDPVTLLHAHLYGCPAETARHQVSLFNSCALHELREGRFLVIRDALKDAACGENQASLASTGMQAMVYCPFVKEGRLVAIMAVGQTLPRKWTEAEVELVQITVERCWAYVDRERLIAELADNNQTLHRTNEDLVRANQELEEFAHVASHDLQEPLRMVNIYTELILKHLVDANQTVLLYGDIIRKAAGRMEELITDLLSFARAAHVEGRDDGAADLSASLSEAMSVLKDGIEQTGAVLTARPLPLVRGNTAQIAHVFQNLISNSLKYRKPTQTPEICIWAEQGDGQWTVAVKDNGIGFEQRYADRIFGLFKRLHTNDYPGTGLGLAICKRIVERYGGRIWAVGKPDSGSTFHFSLPQI